MFCYLNSLETRFYISELGQEMYILSVFYATLSIYLVGWISEWMVECI